MGAGPTTVNETDSVSHRQIEYNQCQEAVRRLNDFLSHELRPEEEDAVQRHLSQCRGCFAKFHFEETLLRTIRERAQQVRAPQPLRDKVLGLIGRSESSPTDTK